MTQRKGRYPESSVPGDHQDTFGVRDVVASYDVGAPALVPEYESLPFEVIHTSVLNLLPESTGCILDVGAGTGRDAAWFAANGHNVVAVEPSAQFRAAGQERHRSPDIRWMNDTLPALEKVLRSKLTFDLVWVSAVWMHVPRSVRARAFRKLVSVMSPGASMMVSLRQGKRPQTRLRARCAFRLQREQDLVELADADILPGEEEVNRAGHSGGRSGRGTQPTPNAPAG